MLARKCLITSLLCILGMVLYKILFYSSFVVDRFSLDQLYDNVYRTIQVIIISLFISD